MTGENVVTGGWRAGHRGATKATTQRPTIKVARTLEDLMQVTAIRAAVFMSDQACP